MSEELIHKRQLKVVEITDNAILVNEAVKITTAFGTEIDYLRIWYERRLFNTIEKSGTVIELGMILEKQELYVGDDMMLRIRNLSSSWNGEILFSSDTSELERLEEEMDRLALKGTSRLQL